MRPSGIKSQGWRLAAMSITMIALCLSSGCFKAEQVPARVDRWSFLWLGGTLFGNPDTLTLKEIHLDTGSLTGREVIVEGQVAEVSRHGTYLVLADSAARILVVLTDMETAGPMLESVKPRALRVLGTVESGVKGLPIIKARSFNFVNETTLLEPKSTKA